MYDIYMYTDVYVCMCARARVYIYIYIFSFPIIRTHETYLRISRISHGKKRYCLYI